MPNLPPVEEYAAPLYVLFILLELFLITTSRARGQYETRDATSSILMGLGSVIVPAVIGGTFKAGIFAVLMFFYQLAPIKWEFGFVSMFACFVLDDLKYYWSHRLQHTIRWGWASHVVHHSSQHFNLSTALRQPWFSFLTGYFVLSIPLVLIGFHPLMIFFAGAINLVYQFFVHTEGVRRLHPWIEYVMNTPSHHRVHHGRNPEYIDSNYAGTLIIWDRLFGTFVPEQDDIKIEYGIIKNLGTFNPFRIATHEYVGIFKDALMTSGLTLKHRLYYVFAPPGWSHDGSRKGSREIKADYVRRNPTKAGMPGLPENLERESISQ